ncbi:MAG: 30S ribosomal protein S6 [Dehalococcoidales bacterium]|jgi:small subunit ribosomal protein S6|nr:30S ribosomal protein S6 [Dehalococcoidales bacterium]MDP6577351.1 30S ribosomal protein S6 [Dehalococcoidales bacterium]MDP6825368.1 30S ribosomal protein S6 [Dehalococcoidales bacterium]MDP7415333.1 30S ribosomal protein S6 [Dehalococcoidales bacterium]|tara:strand:- start:393 stop:734 length:342 start_codon:yes stop_codon:yes gene_type:complete
MTPKTKDSKLELKTEDQPLHDYELIYIISPEVSDEALEISITSVSQFITGKGGSISDEERWGKKKLAYPIKRFLEGNYVLARFKMSPVWSKELEANLRISEDVLRHLLIRMGS